MNLLYKIAGWTDLQHYIDRHPPWVKLHNSIVSEPAWIFGNDVSKLLMIACMLSACRSPKEHGYIDTSETGAAYLKAIAHLESIPDFEPLIRTGWLIPASEALAPASNLPLEERREEEKREKKKKEVCFQIVEFLNKKTKKSYSLDARITRLIQKQIAAGFSESDFRSVIAAKCRDWAGSQMEKYLTPSTLFGDKFPEYVGALVNQEAEDEILS